MRGNIRNVDEKRDGTVFVLQQQGQKMKKKKMRRLMRRKSAK